jgi:hypothetical protein
VLSLLPHRGALITDYRSDILDIALRNLESNSHLSALACTDKPRVVPWKIDWTVDSDSLTGLFVENHPSVRRIFVAADVIYDDSLVESLFAKLSQLGRQGDQIWMTMEKTYNFSLRYLDVVATGYKEFLNAVGCVSDDDRAPVDKNEHSGGKARFRGRIVPVATVPKYVQTYERTDDLEIWEIDFI